MQKSLLRGSGTIFNLRKSLKERKMEKIIIEVDEEITLQIKAKTLEEGIKKLLKQTKSVGKFKSVRLKTKNFKFDREEAESR